MGNYTVLLSCAYIQVLHTIRNYIPNKCIMVRMVRATSAESCILNNFTLASSSCKQVAAATLVLHPSCRIYLSVLLFFAQNLFDAMHQYV